MISETLKKSMNDVRSEIQQLKNSSLNTIEPEIKKTESFIEQINDLHKQIDDINKELDEQVCNFF